MRRPDEHPAARGLGAWQERRRFEYDDPTIDGGESLGALWQLWLAEHACGVADVDYAPEAA